MAVLGTALAFVAFFVWLGYASRRAIAQQLQGLADSSCPTCGSAFGSQTAATARQDYLNECAATSQANPDKRIYFARIWKVTCPTCSAIARFKYETGEFEAESNR